MLNKVDIQNLMSLLKRATYSGLEEAQVGLQLAHKLQEMAQALDAPPKE